MPRVMAATTTLAVISNQAYSLVNFRGPLIEALVQTSAKVYALAPDFDTRTRERILALGAVPVDYSLRRTGMNPLQDLQDLLGLMLLLRRLRPDATFGYFIKPVIYGSIASWLAGVPYRYSLIAGLGYVFGDDEAAAGPRRRILRRIVRELYRFALARNEAVFLQNQVDKDELCANGALDEAKVVLLAGTGVDLGHFAFSEPVTSPVTFVLVARMLGDKGVYEFVEAARMVRERCSSAQFVLVGGVDENPSVIPEATLKKWVAEGVVEWSGHVDDVRPWLRRASVFVLPSYREGKPRSTQEAMAVGRPIITTDAPGCRDTVVEGLNGFLVPVRDSAALAAAMLKFLANPELIPRMGACSRSMAEDQFDIHRINAQMIAVMCRHSAIGD